LHAVFTQPGVRRYIFDDEIIRRDQTVELIAQSVTLFAERQFGLWLARTAAADLIGFGAFWFFRDPPQLELLYGVADADVGRGYGREIGRAVVRYGFDVLQMPVIRASIDYGLVRSTRLVEDLGFAFDRRATVGGLDTVFYVATRPPEGGGET
jgi:ribosomal-protein-alanine N-acetyltransferase